MSGLDDEINAARERARSAADRQQQHDEQKADILRDAVQTFWPFGDDVFVSLRPVVGRIRSAFADYHDDEGRGYKADARRRCWIIDGSLALFASLPALGQIEPAGSRIKRHTSQLPYYEHLSMLNPMPPDSESTLDDLRRQLADAFVRYETAGRRWPKVADL